MGLIVFIVIMVLGVSIYDYFDTKDWQLMTSAERNNVVFDQRNKKYGAYTLRRDYNDLVILILLIMAGIVIAAALIGSGFRAESPGIVPQIVMDTTELELQAPPMEKIETLPTPIKLAGGGGSGTPDDAKIDPTPDPMNIKQETIEKSDSHAKAGEGNKNNGENKTNEASTTVKGKSPFGSGGSGGGDQGGRGKGFGNDEGDGKGPGKGPGQGGGDVKRQLIQKPNTNNIHSDESCTIVLRVRMDADGNVIAAVVDRSQSSTDNSVIINQVISLVKSQAKYSAKPGAGIEGVLLTVNVSAN